MINIEKITFNPFQENTYILFDHTGEGIVIDPGMSNRKEEQQFADFVEEKNINLLEVINTHCHIDHVLGNAFCCEKYGIPLAIPEGELEMLDMATRSAEMFQIAYNTSPAPTHLLKEGGAIEFGASRLEIILAPGHSPGHVVLIDEIERFVIGGDVLFRDSVGRIDLPGGDGKQLVESIRKKLFTLPDDFMVHPGHGPATQIGYEKKSNPFVGEGVSDFF